MLPCKDSDGYIWEKVNQKERAEITCILVGIYCSIFFLVAYIGIELDPSFQTVGRWIG